MALFLVLFMLAPVSFAQWTAENYWNSRFSGELSYIDYDAGKQKIYIFIIRIKANVYKLILVYYRLIAK